MYKISEVAELVGVEKVDIFEKLITHKAIIDPCIQKIDGVTYFDDRGIDILKTLFFGSQASEPILNDIKTDEIKAEKRVVKVRSKFERERDILYDKILILKSELTKMDEELSMKDEMLISYQRKLVDDLESIHKFQTMLMKKS